MFVIQTNTVGVEFFSYVNALQLICKAAWHVSENALLLTTGGLQKCKLLHQLLLGLTEIFMFFSFDFFPRP